MKVSQRIDLTEDRKGRKKQQPIFAYLSALMFKKRELATKVS